MLEITIDGTGKYVLKESNLFNESDIISFSLLLSSGNINNIENLEYKKVNDISFSPKEEVKQLKKKVKQYQDIRIWYASRDNEDICTMYYLVNFLSQIDKTIYICDVSDGHSFSLGSYLSNEVEPLLANTKLLTQEQIDIISSYWQKLVMENADLRIIEDNKLVSKEFEYLDNKILEVLSNYETIKFYGLIGKCMSNGLCGFWADFIFIFRVNYLIETGKIEVCDVKKEKNLIGEITEQKYIRLK